ncbi:sugar phosphate nucleotidyltransferase [Aureliella helgolandensis]|nr:sugar phosphate nucleotidyltransferase [Aureliella helgolandensis]
MRVRKAIITAAGVDRTQLPLQTVVDRVGRVRTALDLLIDEVVAAGIEEIAVVIRPGLKPDFKQAATDHAATLEFIEQDHPRGYGDAVLRTRAFVGNAPFLHLVHDHLYVSRSRVACAKQLIDIAERENCAVSAIQATRENQLAYFGAIGGIPIPRQSRLYEIRTVIEKPTPTEAEQKLMVAGQRAGHYLCLFGMHVLTSEIFDLLQHDLERLPAGASLNLSGALAQFASSHRYLAAELEGVRYDIGEKYGLLIAQLAIALSGDDRDRILTEMLELVAKSSPHA